MELLERAALHATVILSDHDGDATVRLGALAALAQISPAAAGEMAADLPDLTGDDPRTEPAARERARQWIDDALRLTDHKAASRGDAEAGNDAQAVLDGQAAIRDWPIYRFVTATAEATAPRFGQLDASMPPRRSSPESDFEPHRGGPATTRSCSRTVRSGGSIMSASSVS